MGSNIPVEDDTCCTYSAQWYIGAPEGQDQIECTDFPRDQKGLYRWVRTMEMPCRPALSLTVQEEVPLRAATLVHCIQHLLVNKNPLEREGERYSIPRA